MNITFSEQVMTLACRFSLIEAGLSSAKKPHLFCQLLKNFFETINSRDPSQIHYDIARSYLCYLDKEALKKDSAVDMLARELLEACHQFDERFELPASFARLIKHDQKIPNDPYLIIIDLTKAPEAFEEQFFTADGNTLWDSAYLKLLESIGTAGKRQSKELSNKFTSVDKKWDACFWFKEYALEGGGHFFHTPAFLGLAEILWYDIVLPRISKF